MSLMLWILGFGMALDLLLWLPLQWHGRQVVAALALVATAFASSGLLVLRPSLGAAVLLGVSLYRLFNDIRLLQGRMHEGYLWRTTRRTAAVLIILQGLVVGLWWLWARYPVAGRTTWELIAALQLGVAALQLATTIRHLRRTRWPHLPHTNSGDLPTVTVAIPARNETDDLQQCLESIIASDYPKLEVLVLDDCSQTKRTPEIIRSFAHDGVRFIEGKAPSDSWLPKNQAYDRLVQEASGEYVLFCGVDLRLAPHAIRQLVDLMQARHKTMICVLPHRANANGLHFAIAQAIRYCWELVPPRRLFRRPPVLSSCWMIKTTSLQQAGGFAAVARAIVPEAHFASVLAATDGYSFVRADASIQSTKSASEQRQTAIRMRYPQLHRRPENVCLFTLIESVFLLMPFVLCLAGWLALHSVAISLLSGLASALLVVVFALVCGATGTVTPWLSVVVAPWSVLYDLALIHYSMWRYEFSTVEWKGRNVCVPAMHVVPQLPRLRNED